MAILTICSVKDSAAQAFNRPIFVPHANLARRSFQDEVNRGATDNQMSTHPNDFELYELGFFDEDLAAFTLHETPRLIARAIDLKDVN